MFDVFGFYKFKKLTSLKRNKILLQDFLIKKNIRGTIIIASEGVNATISGKASDLKSTITKIKKILDFKNLITSYLLDEKKIIIAGKAATEIVFAHSGASIKIADQICIK